MLDKETIRELRRRLKKIEHHLYESAPDPLVLVRARVATFASQSVPTTENSLHECRIEGKKIRYLSEVAIQNPEAQRIIEELKRMQDVLGLWHDWLTLTATSSKLLPETTNSPLQSAIRNILGAKYREAVQAVSLARTNLLKKPAAVHVTASEKGRAAAAAEAVA
jgi:CHAD domain-containing protein